MAHRPVLLAFYFFALVGCATVSMRAALPPPNIIMINCDDLGYSDLVCYGARDIRTPHLDRMARDGTRFTDLSVTSPLCTPLRAALMTGKYPGRVGLAMGIRPDAEGGLAGSETTLATSHANRGLGR